MSNSCGESPAETTGGYLPLHHFQVNKNIVPPPGSASDVDHQKADWVSIHEKICQLLVPVRTSLPFLIPEEERKRGVEQLVKRQVRTRRKEHHFKVLPPKFNYISSSYMLMCLVLGGRAVG